MVVVVGVHARFGIDFEIAQESRIRHAIPKTRTRYINTHTRALS
jgi:hypothetical protein